MTNGNALNAHAHYILPVLNTGKMDAPSVAWVIVTCHATMVVIAAVSSFLLECVQGHMNSQSMQYPEKYFEIGSFHHFK